MMFILSIIMYMVPIVVLLPFKLSWLNKLLLSMILIANFIHMSLFTGNAGVIILLITVSMYIACIDKNRLRNVCLFVLGYLINVILDNVTSSLLWLFTGLDLETRIASPILDYSLTVLHIVLLYTICKLSVHIFNKLTSHIPLPSLPGKTVFFIGINLLLTLSLFVVNIIAGEQIGYSHLVVAFNTVIFLACFIVTTWTIIRSVQFTRKESDMQVRQLSYENLQKYTTQVEELYNGMRSFKHDYANILTTLYGYIDNKDITGLEEYFKKQILPLSATIAPENYQIGRLSHLKITELKSLVMAKVIYAEEMKIDINIEISQPVESVNMDIVDLARIIGILLDNAIEAALETEHPKFSFAAIQETRELVFIIANSFINKNLSLTELKKPTFSTKGENRGIGLYNVFKMMEANKNIFLDTQIESDTFIQTLHIYNN